MSVHHVAIQFNPENYIEHFLKFVKYISSLIIDIYSMLPKNKSLLGKSGWQIYISNIYIINDPNNICLIR